jgi:hypothetical protein
MKSKFMAALIAAAGIVLLSCNWFTQIKEPANPLIGKWNLDSVSTTARDSGLGLAIALWAIKEDSSRVIVDFRKDTVFSITSADTDTVFYRWDEMNKQIITKYPSNTDTLLFEKLNDSLIRFTAKDSTVLYLKRK